MTRRAHGEGGYALVTVIGVCTVLLLLVTAGFAAVDGANGTSVRDARAKDARAAADAGVALYASRLAADPDYWSKCTNTGDDPVWSGTAGTRRWKTVDNADPSDTAPPEYTIELVPAAGSASCQVDTPATVFDPTTNAIRIKVTGRDGGVRRTVVASFRRGSLLQYLYYTTYETTDTGLYPVTASDGRTRAWAGTNCAKVYGERSSACSDIQFADADEVNGPLHTQDRSLLLCGSPKLGRGNDSVEVMANGGAGWRTANDSCGTTAPTLNTNPTSVELPTSINDTLKSTASSTGYSYKGKTALVLNGDTFTANGGAARPLPPKGVIYVEANGASCAEIPNPRTVNYGDETNAMALAYVRGTANRDITIASECDVVINGNLTASATTKPLIGLAAENYVRVYHPVKITVPFNATYTSGSRLRDSPGTTYKPGSYRCDPNRNTVRWCTDTYKTVCENATGTNNSLQIDAAILALGHSFVVDNWGTASYYEDTDFYDNCGKLGNLAVNGAIIQNFRGPVGTGGSSADGTGYTKLYGYEDRLKVRNPPFFPQPQGSVWRVARATEQATPDARP